MRNLRSVPSMRSRQRGVVLIFCLIVLIILLAGGVAVVRSMNSSMFSAGNMAFKRDLLNQGEQAIAVVMAKFATGAALGSSLSTQADVVAENYKASRLDSNAQGIPSLLLADDEAFGTVGTVSNDITVASAKATIRYLIDRQCSTTGAATSNNCVQDQSGPTGGTGSAQAALLPPTSSVYRLSVRVDGPRDTQVFLQTSFTKPD